MPPELSPAKDRQLEKRRVRRLGLYGHRGRTGLSRRAGKIETELQNIDSKYE